MIYMWFIGINCYKLAVEKDRDSILTTIITTIWRSGFIGKSYFADLRMTFRQKCFLQDWFRNKLGVGLG